MKIVVIDGQGGGMGRALVERVRAAYPDKNVIAVGTNAAATSAMLRAGATAGATGENAVLYHCRTADVILGPIGILTANGLMGEISPAMADAVGGCEAYKLLLPSPKCRVRVAGTAFETLDEAMNDVLRMLGELLHQ